MKNDGRQVAILAKGDRRFYNSMAIKRKYETKEARERSTLKSLTKRARNSVEKKLRKIHDSNTVWKLSSQLLINFEQESLENVLEAWNGSITTSTWSQRAIPKSMTYIVNPKGNCLVTYDTPIQV